MSKQTKCFSVTQSDPDKKTENRALNIADCDEISFYMKFPFKVILAKETAEIVTQILGGQEIRGSKIRCNGVSYKLYS